MFNEKDTIHFSCKKCGSCCSTTPNMTLFDMMELSDEFIFQTSHNVSISYATSPLEKNATDYYRMISHTIVMPELEASMFYYVDFSILPLQTSRSCEKLKNKECSIYIKRPNACKLLPLSNKFDETLQWKTINFFKDMTQKADWKCDFSSNAPILIKDNEIYNRAYKTIYNIEMENIRDFTDKYMGFIDFFGHEKKNQHLKRLFNSVRNKQTLISDIIFSLQVAIFNSLITVDDANIFLKKQLVLIKKRHDDCINQKDKNNLQVSRVYKKLIDDYQKVIEKNVFEQDVTNHFNV